ncbi:MAG: GNAT family N-acetyltransferase [Pseudomonadota bacterium]
MIIRRVREDDHNERLSWVEARLSAALSASIPGENFRPFVLEARDNAQELCGGLVAYASWDWLVIDSMEVDESVRRRGLGKALVCEAEAIGAAMGCVRAQLETYSAESFWLRRGYTVVSCLDDYPPGGSFVRMVKLLHPHQSWWKRTDGT